MSSSSEYMQKHAYILTVMLVLLAGLRWEIWTDWDNYYDCFVNNGDSEIDFEIGYVLWNRFINVFSDSYTVYLLVSYGLLLTIFLFLVKCFSESYYIVSFLIFYTIYLLPSGGFRQFVATFFFLIAVYCVVGNRIKNAILFIIVGSMIHRSLLLCLPFLFFYDKEFIIKRFWWLLVIAIGISQMGIFMMLINLVLSIFVDERYVSYTSRILLYTSDDVDDGIFNFTFLRHVIFAVFFLFFYKIGINNEEGYDMIKYKRVLNLNLIGVLMFVVLVGQFERLAAYFISTECLLLPMSYHCMKSKETRIRFTLFLVLLMGFMLVYKMLTYYPELFVPYNNVITNSLN